MLSKEMQESLAYKSLRSPNHKKVLEILINKPGIKYKPRRGYIWIDGVEYWKNSKKVKDLTSKQGRKPAWPIDENIKIFTIKEAEEIYNIKVGSFRGAIKNLMAKGFIDLLPQKRYTKHIPNRYSMSNRWKKYGTKNFNYSNGSGNRIKPIAGFQKGNQWATKDLVKKTAWLKEVEKNREQIEERYKLLKNKISSLVRPYIDKSKDMQNDLIKSRNAARRLFGEGSTEVTEIEKQLRLITRHISLAKDYKEGMLEKVERVKKGRLMRAAKGSR